MNCPNEIHSHPCSNCYLCGAQGQHIYQGLKDELYDTSGEWNLKKCSNPECGLVWLDPMPNKEDIGKIYREYHTHQNNSISISQNKFKRNMKSFAWWSYSTLLKITFVQRMRRRYDLMYLKPVKLGRLLDVGCGNGKRLSQMQAVGWNVEGQEIDPKAVEYARRTYGLKIHLGTLQDLSFPDSSFDVITIGHVIEHALDPLALLVECHRILKPAGVLVITTPNIESLGHKYFKSYWRGLEVPRHLFLFSQKTLRTLCGKASFNNCRTWTTGAYSSGIALESLNIMLKNKQQKDGDKKKWRMYMWAFGFQLVIMLLRIIDKNTGEECVLKSIKEID